MHSPVTILFFQHIPSAILESISLLISDKIYAVTSEEIKFNLLRFLTEESIIEIKLNVCSCYTGRLTMYNTILAKIYYCQLDGTV